MMPGTAALAGSAAGRGGNPIYFGLYIRADN